MSLKSKVGIFFFGWKIKPINIWLGASRENHQGNSRPRKDLDSKWPHDALIDLGTWYKRIHRGERMVPKERLSRWPGKKKVESLNRKRAKRTEKQRFTPRPNAKHLLRERERREKREVILFTCYNKMNNMVLIDLNIRFLICRHQKNLKLPTTCNHPANKQNDPTYGARSVSISPTAKQSPFGSHVRVMARTLRDHGVPNPLSSADAPGALKIFCAFKIWRRKLCCPSRAKITWGPLLLQMWK